MSKEKIMKTESKVYLGLIFVALTILTAFLTKWGWLTYEDLKFAAGFVLVLMGYFFESFKNKAKDDVIKEQKHTIELQNNYISLLKNRS